MKHKDILKSLNVEYGMFWVECPMEYQHEERPLEVNYCEYCQGDGAVIVDLSKPAYFFDLMQLCQSQDWWEKPVPKEITDCDCDIQWNTYIFRALVSITRTGTVKDIGQEIVKRIGEAIEYDKT